MKSKNFFLPSLIGVSALILSGTSAYFSIFGLSRLFSGASLEVIVMAGGMELSKIVLVLYLHRYWKQVSTALKIYLIASVTALMVITSIGAYGFLSSAFQSSLAQYEVDQIEINAVQNKVNFFEDEIDRLNKDLDRTSANIQQLVSSRSVEIEVRDTTTASGFRNTVSTLDNRLAEQRLQQERQDRELLRQNREQVSDSLRLYTNQLIDRQSSSELSAELGPLQFISEVVEKPISEVVNILVLVIILVFDPLALSMILSASMGIRTNQSPPSKPINTVDVNKSRTGNKESNQKVQESLPNLSEERHRKTVSTSKKQSQKKQQQQQQQQDLYPEINQDRKPEKTPDSEIPLKVLQKTPSFYHLLMKDGSRKKVPKSEIEVKDNENTIRYL